MRYELKKNLAGAYSVKFKCPKCGIKLAESLKNAGQQDTCPECGQKFVIPGAEELSRQRKEQDRIAAEKAARKDAEEIEKQRAKSQQKKEREEKKIQEEQIQQQREREEQRRFQDVQSRLVPKEPSSLDRNSTVRHSGIGLAILSAIMFLYSAWCTFSASVATEMTVMQQIVITLRIYGSLIASCVLLVGSCLCHVITRK